MARTKITKRSEDYSKWYLDIISNASLAENSPIRGCMVIKPYGYALWEKYHEVLDRMFKDTGHQNAYFPLFIPKSFLNKEAEHVDGFAKESAVVTHYRLKKDELTGQLIPDPDAKLEEELIVRPTSETIIYDTFARWIKSYRDLPLLINQWANVVRWEMRTRPFLRTSEFLWQEGHTAHETLEQADEEARKMLGIYKTFTEEYLAIPVIDGTKSEGEKFAGAYRTYTIEAMMQDGKALQGGTSHNLTDNFAKAFSVSFTNRNGEKEYVHQTSWGYSTRMIGGLIMTHSDDNGLVLPPKIAPTQVVIIPILKNKDEDTKILEFSNILQKNLREKSNLSVNLDNRDYLSFGEKSYEWEKKGVPLRIEVGMKEVDSSKLTIILRDTGEKKAISLSNAPLEIQQELEVMQKRLFTRAKERLDSSLLTVNSLKNFEDIMESGDKFLLCFVKITPDLEKQLKDKYKASIRCIPFLYEGEKEGKCIFTGDTTTTKVVIARSY